MKNTKYYTEVAPKYVPKITKILSNTLLNDKENDVNKVILFTIILSSLQYTSVDWKRAIEENFSNRWSSIQNQ